MEIADKLAVVKAIAGFQNAWTSVSFKEFGSLYYAKDLEEKPVNEPLYTDANGIVTPDAKFAIGPSTGQEMIDDGRVTIEFDRGPWETLEEYHNGIGRREIACVHQLPCLPKSLITLCGPGTYQPTRERKLKALHCYLELIKFLLPTDRSIATSHLWHGDLHVANIFISPLYFHARQPHVIDYNGPPVSGLEQPQLPEDVDQLDPIAKKQAEDLYFHQSLCVLYNTLTHHQNPKLYAALEFQETMSYLLLLLARNLLIDGEATYLSQVAELEATWGTLPGAKGSLYPFSFSKIERQEMEANVEGVVRGMAGMRLIRESLNELFPEQGIVRSDLYGEALDALE